MTTNLQWVELDEAVARGFFESYVGSHGDRLARFEARWVEAGLDRAQLDFSRASLEAVWGFVLRHHAVLRPTPGPGEREAILAFIPEVPGWTPPEGVDPRWVVPPLVRDLDLEGVRAIDEVAAYFAQCLIVHDSAFEWAMPVGDQAAFRFRPVLQRPLAEGSRTLSVYAFGEVETAVWNAANDRDRGRELDWLQQRFDFWCDPTPSFGVVDDPDIEVARRGRDEVIDDDDPTHVVSFSDAVAHGRSEDVDELVRQLAEERRVVEVWREDREVVFVRTSMSDRSLRKLVERVWGALRPS